MSEGGSLSGSLRPPDVLDAERGCGRSFQYDLAE